MEDIALSVWKVSQHAQLHWLDWDGQHLLHDETSGDTYLMDDVGAAVFHCLLQSDGLDEIDLLHRAAGLLELPPDDHLLDRTHEILQRFARSRLLEQRASS
jgi:hypothetical protein